MSAVEMTRLALLKMYGAAPPVSLSGLSNLPHLPGLPADILHQAQQHQDNALNLHLQRQKAAISESKDHERLRSDMDEDDDEDDDTKEAVEADEDETNNGKSDASSPHNENSMSPAPPGVNNRKRHRSNDSEDIEEVVSSPAKKQPLGIPGANIKIASRGRVKIDVKATFQMTNAMWLFFQVMAATETPHLLSAWKLMVPPTKVFCLLNLASIGLQPRRNVITAMTVFDGKQRKKETLLVEQLLINDDVFSLKLLLLSKKIIAIHVRFILLKVSF